jgi:uncharacterized protein (TIGR02246 family)
MRFALVSVLSLIALGACTQSPSSSPAPAVDAAKELSAIHDVEQAQAAAFAAHNLDGAMASYAADAVVFLPFEAPLQGAEAIRADMQHFIADPNMALHITPGAAEVAASGDIAYTTSSYTVSFTDEKTHQAVTHAGNNVTLWKKQADGSWKEIRDINIAMPEPEASHT